jgi:hypothetical protein
MNYLEKIEKIVPTVKHGSKVTSGVAIFVEAIDVGRPAESLAIANERSRCIFVLKDAELEPGPGACFLVLNDALIVRVGYELKTYGTMNELGFERTCLEPELRDDFGIVGIHSEWLFAILENLLGEENVFRHGWHREGGEVGRV